MRYENTCNYLPNLCRYLGRLQLEVLEHRVELADEVLPPHFLLAAHEVVFGVERDHAVDPVELFEEVGDLEGGGRQFSRDM